ncbi:carotenoid biosynthesis protein [Granulicella sp. S190]|jgi:uncharacterized membrane protein|uniref:carotenoid biosynthesis protein n=1 Tax=Granulicella sp. S190 TaxID=1747226 RepID=UPI00131D4CE1|nr:carotenoid biosynthesis protein [Granulicella sp. S190]
MGLTKREDAVTRHLLAGLLFIYALGRILQLYAGQVPTLIIVVLHVVPPAIFALLHGSLLYKPRGMLLFFALCLGTSTFFESLSLRTGFPFGHYYFTDVMGPKLFQLPVLLALAYVGMCYLSWVIALLLTGRPNETIRGKRVLLLPLIASCIMVAWDLSMDPVWANIDHAWVWRDGGAYFGVPISNFLGWLLTTYTFYQLFAFYMKERKPVPVASSNWILPICFYGLSAAGNVLLLIPSTAGAVVTDHSGRRWMVSHILFACVFVSVFVMGGFTLFASARLSRLPPPLSADD